MSICSEAGCEKPHKALGFCKDHYNRDYYRRNKEAVDNQHKAYYDTNRAATLKQKKVYYAINREIVRAQKRQRYDEDKDAILKRNREWYAANRETRLASVRAWQQAHPENDRAKHSRRRQRSSVSMTAQDRHDSVEWRKSIRDNPCFYCGAENADKYHDDHATPLSKGGSDHWWNIVRACQLCNLRKGVKTAEEFIEEMENQ